VLFLSEGVGRRAQRKLHALEKKLEMAEINQKNSSGYLEKLAQETEKLKIEKEAYQNLVNCWIYL
jgi:hypothetical protein